MLTSSRRHDEKGTSTHPHRRETQPVPANPTESEAGVRRFDESTAALSARYFDGDTAGFMDDWPVIRSLARRSGGPLLELGCGTGRLLIPLARAGYSVTGVDLSAAMLDIAGAKAVQAGVADRITLLQGDFAAVALPTTYRFAFVVMNTFMHLLTQAEQLAALRHWREHLTPDGLLLIDVFQPDVGELSGFDGRVEFDKMWIDPANGSTVVKQVIRSVDQTEQLVHIVMLYDEVAQDGQMQRSVVPFDLRYLWRNEAQLLLEMAGFTLEGIYGDWTLAPLDAAGERMILVARRRG